MTIRELAKKVDAQLYLQSEEATAEVEAVYSASTMSDLIAHAATHTLLLTTLCSTQLIRVAELMDAPGLCLAHPAEPRPELLAAAARSGIPLMLSPYDLPETRRRLEDCLIGRGAART